ncbi:GDSL-type esterase/lipase family protein [Tyzzerella sp. OttesenSCG-928-J15]|nr:GDSL-type esterase/lipase family protein [Tyzzerella sp. OttesenSCG-928-J15]
MMKILCLGDSLTFGYGVSPKENWVCLVEKQTGICMVNEAVNGNTTGGMLAYFPYAVKSHKPDAVFIMGGSNNILFSDSDVSARSDMGALIYLCFHEKIRPIVGIPIAMNPPVRRDWASITDIHKAQNTSDSYCLWLRDFCRIFSKNQLTCIDFRKGIPLMALEQGIDINSWYLDGIHLNTEGQRVMAKVFIEDMNKSKMG